MLSRLPRVERLAFLGNYVPRLCGIATFTRDLCEAVSTEAPELNCYAVAVTDRDEGYDYPPRVRRELRENNVDSYRRVADCLNFDNADVLCVQHEFGIYGGPAGAHLLALLEEVRMPVVTTLHTVLSEPDGTQRRVMREIERRSSRLVVMAEKGAEILRRVYGVPEVKIEVIPHGIPDIAFHDPGAYKAQFGVGGRTVLLTFGLIGPGKGIEHVIRALPEIVREHPEVVYLVVGATHPQLVAREGERYRLSLEWLAEELGVKKHVIFYNRFVTAEDLREFIRATDIYLTPYLNEEQITSGTLAQVFGAGKAVIATPYWHARELLTEGRGTLVPFAQPAALAAAVGAYLNDPGLMQRTREAAWQAGRGMIWPAVARRYLECFEAVREEAREPARSAFAGWNAAARTYDLPPPRLDHLVRMFDGTGMLQHALFTVPDFHHGYCTDDNARAYILCCYLDGLGTSSREQCLRGLGTRSLAFLVTALHRETGRFRNFMSFERRWLEVAGSEDSHGRAMWALGTGARQARDPGQRQLSTEWFVHGMSVVEEFTAPRSWAFTLLGLHEFIGANPEHRAAKELREKLMSGLVKLWHHASSPDWPWFEGSVTYDNARLSQALMLSGRSAGNEEAFRIGEESLRWLVSIQTTPAGCFRPVGSGGFYVREGVRAHFDQQPVEAQAMVAACLDAWRLTGEEMWFREARRAFEWFLGRNDLSLPLYDPASGGCADGLHVDRINQNQGAESTLAFHLALAAMNFATHPLAAEGI